MAYEFITESGVIVSDTSETKTTVENEYKIIAGDDSTIDASSFEGRLIDMFTNQRVSVARNNVDLANQLNPNMAENVFLDAHLANVGSARDGKERSTCECLLSGVAGTIIPSGSAAQDDAGYYWETVVDWTIGSGGSVTASLRCAEYGAISAGIGEINKIFAGVVGWETVTNEVAAVEGKLVQSDVSARKQRRNEIGTNSNSVPQSVIAAVSALEGVDSMVFRENREPTEETIDGVVMAKNSSWICVDGGVTSEIAGAYISKTWGTAFNGAVEYDYTDEYSGQVTTVKIDRPTDVPLQCEITARVGQSQDADSDIRSAIVDYANGLVDGEDGFKLGEDASPFEIASAVNAQLPDVFVTKCELREVGGTYSTDTIVTAIYEKASIDETNITVNIV